MTVSIARIEVRRDTAANWATADPILGDGEPGLVSDTRQVKYGDGSTAFSALPFSVIDGTDGAQGPAGLTCPPFGYSGPLAVYAGTARWYNDSGRTLTIGTVRASVGTAPTGAPVIVDVFKNGTTIFTGGTGRPSISAAAFTATGTPAVTTVAAGEYLTVSIVQVGSTVPGSDLTVQLALT